MNGLGVDDIYTAVAVDAGDKGGSVRETKKSAEANSNQERRQPGISEKMTSEGLYDAATVCPASKCRRSRDPLVPRRMTPEFWGNICLQKEQRQMIRGLPGADQIRFEIESRKGRLFAQEIQLCRRPRCRVITLQRTQMRVSVQGKIASSSGSSFPLVSGPRTKAKISECLCTDVRNEWPVRWTVSQRRNQHSL